MNENGMPVHTSCKNCLSKYCNGDQHDQQPDFAGLQVTVADEHDQKLVDARMLDVVSSTESRKTTTKSSDVSMRMHSDYCLKRFMASFGKLGTFLNRLLPRAKTHMDLNAHAHHDALQRSNTN